MNYFRRKRFTYLAAFTFSLLMVSYDNCGGLNPAPQSPAATTAAPNTPGTAGPLDGTWKLSTLGCNGTSQNLSATQETRTISGSNSSDSITASGCTVTVPETVSYPTSATATFNFGTNTCSGCPTCPQIQGTVQTYSYSISGSTLNLTRTISSPATPLDICTSGQTETIQMIKQ